MIWRARPRVLVVLAVFSALLACNFTFGQVTPSATPAPPTEVLPTSTPTVTASASPTPAPPTTAPSATPAPPTATATPHPLAAELDPPRHGVIVARLNGQQYTWHTGVVLDEGEPLNLSYWRPTAGEPGQELTTFSINGLAPASFAALTGDTTSTDSGTAITLSVLNLPLRPGATFQLSVPPGPDSPRVVLSHLGSYEGRNVGYVLSSGELTITLLHATIGEPARVAGTFSGTLSDSRDNEPRAPDLQLSEGHFYVEVVHYNPILE